MKTKNDGMHFNASWIILAPVISQYAHSSLIWDVKPSSINIINITYLIIKHDTAVYAIHLAHLPLLNYPSLRFLICIFYENSNNYAHFCIHISVMKLNCFCYITFYLIGIFLFLDNRLSLLNYIFRLDNPNTANLKTRTITYLDTPTCSF